MPNFSSLAGLEVPEKFGVGGGGGGGGWGGGWCKINSKLHFEWELLMKILP